MRYDWLCNTSQSLLLLVRYIYISLAGLASSEKIDNLSLLYSHACIYILKVYLS